MSVQCTNVTENAPIKQPGERPQYLAEGAAKKVFNKIAENNIFRSILRSALRDEQTTAAKETIHCVDFDTCDIISSL